jgi:hypothetical protein
MPAVPPANQPKPPEANPRGAMDLRAMWQMIKALIDALLNAVQQHKRQGCGECEALATKSLEDAMCIANCQLQILSCCEPLPEPPAKP